MSKKFNKLKEAIQKVKEDNSKDNIRDLIGTSVQVFRQGDGLLWSDLETILNDEFGYKITMEGYYSDFVEVDSRQKDFKIGDKVVIVRQGEALSCLRTKQVKVMTVSKVFEYGNQTRIRLDARGGSWSSDVVYKFIKRI